MSDSHGTDETILLGIIELAEAKRLRGILEGRGIRLDLINNPETCPPGPLGGRVEVYARAADADAFRELVKAERAKLLDGLPTSAASSDASIDFEQASGTCPACGAQFSTTLTECPECGLGFGVPAGLETGSDE